MRKRISTIIFVIIFLIGLSILLYPAVSEYVNERHSSRAIASYDKLVEELPEADYSKELQDAQAYNEYLAQFGNLSEAASTEKEREDSPYEDLLNTGGSGIMSIINIPGIAVELPVYHGTSEGVLQVAAGHYEGSSLPVGGESTHAIITGHRGLPSAKLFTDLDRLETGDVFYLKTLGEILEYQIDQIVTVLPSEVDGLSIEPGKDYVTLVTCTPYGINSHRLLIRGTRIPYDGKYAEKVPLKPAPAVSDRPAEEQGRKLGTRQWILFAIAAFGVAILLGILAPSGKKPAAKRKKPLTKETRNSLRTAKQRRKKEAMKRMKKKNKMAAFLAAVILMTMSVCQGAFAGETAGIDTARPVSLTIDLEAESKKATISIYEVGEWDGAEGAYALSQEFTGSGADIGDHTATGALSAAQTLEQFIKNNQIGALSTQATATGKIQFTGLSSGLYLVCQFKASGDNVTVSPYLTTLPVLNEETNTWVYDVRSLPKYEADSTGGGGHSGGGGGGSSTTGRHAAQTNESVDVPDNDVPKAENPIVKAIEDVLVPLGILPKTGDNSTSIEIMSGITVMSAALLVLLIAKRRRKDA